MLLALFAFVALQLAVGFAAARRIRSTDDFFVAGRCLGPGLASASLFATWFGAESCVGAAGQAYQHGIGPTSTEPFAYGVCLVLMGLCFAAPLWRLRLTTLADLFALRFGPSTERFAAVLLLPSSVLWAAAQVRAFGHVVASNADGAIGVAGGTAIAAAVAIVYTTSGGLLADVYTDAVQSVVLVGGLLCLLFAVPWDLAPAPAAAAAGAPAAGLLELAETWAVPILGSIVAQEALSRSLAARSPAIARRAAVLGGSLYLVVGLVPLTLGLLGQRLLPGLADADAEAVLPQLALRHLPAALNVLFAAGLIAAILSTVDSCLLVAAAVLTRNLGPLARSPAAPARTLGTTRAAVALAGLVAYALACTGLDVHELVAEASGFGSAGIFVIAVAGTFGGGGSPLAANLALGAGVATWITGRYLCPELVAAPYLLSLAAAVAAFGLGAAWARHRRVPGAPASGQSPP